MRNRKWRRNEERAAICEGYGHRVTKVSFQRLLLKGRNRRAAALGVGANRITLLRDADRDGIAEERHTFMEGLNQPFGMALLNDTFYVGNTDGVIAFPYATGANTSLHRGDG